MPTILRNSASGKVAEGSTTIVPRSRSDGAANMRRPSVDSRRRYSRPMVQVADGEARPGTGGTSAVIEAVDLGRRFDDLEAVRHVSFSVPPGETFGFLGPNGAGKATTISMLCTLLRLTSGLACVAVYDVARQRTVARREIGVLLSDTTLIDTLTSRA